MEESIDRKINKDLILRERLAMERTAMANDTTLLAFIRTALYFSVAGMSVNKLLNIKMGTVIEIAFWIVAAVILLIGIVKYRKQKQRLKESEKFIGNYP